MTIKIIVEIILISSGTFYQLFLLKLPKPID